MRRKPGGRRTAAAARCCGRRNGGLCQAHLRRRTARSGRAAEPFVTVDPGFRQAAGGLRLREEPEDRESP